MIVILCERVGHYLLQQYAMQSSYLWLYYTREHTKSVSLNTIPRFLWFSESHLNHLAHKIPHSNQIKNTNYSA